MTDDKRVRPDHDVPRPDRTPEERRDWETLQQNETDSTQRLLVKDGWLYRTVTAAGVAMVFVADPTAEV